MLRERRRKRRKFRKRMEINNESFDQSLSGTDQNKYPINQVSSSSSFLNTSPKGIKDDRGGSRNKEVTGKEDPTLVTNFNLRQEDNTAFVKVSNSSNSQATTSTSKSKNNYSNNIINNTNKQSKSMKKKKNNNSILSRRRSSLSVDLEVATIQTRDSSTFSPTSASSSQQFVYDDDFYPESHDSEDEGVFLTASNNSSSIHNTKDNVDIDTDHDTDLILSSPSPYLMQHDEHYQPSTLQKGTPIPPRKNNHISHPNPHQNVHSSMSLLSVTTNNAITIAPSRNQILEPNVFDTGGVSRHHPKRHKEGRVHNKQHNQGRRSKTPEPKYQPHNQLQPPFTHNFYYNPTTNIAYNNRRRNNDSVCTNNSVEDSLQSVLNRLDNRIKKNFGDWSEVDDDKNFEYRNVGFGTSQQHQSNNKLPHPQKKKMINPYFGGEDALHRHSSLDLDDLDSGPYNNSHSNNSQTSNVTLPPLIKTYHAVLRSSKGKLQDKSKKIAMSRDNNDPNSILSRAKATLNGL